VAFKKCPFLKAEFFLTLVNSKEEKMKRFWLVLLSLGLVMAFSASAFAVDVKFSGSYYVVGMYLDQTSLIKGSEYMVTGNPAFIASTPPGLTNMPYLYPGTPNRDNQSTAFFYQRLRIGTDFIVSPGLKLVTRFDALDRVWGSARSTAGAYSQADSSYSIATRAEQENIAFNLAYVEYASPIGLFQVGYIHDNAWGLTFGQSDQNGHATGGIQYLLPIGSWYFGGIVYKESSSSYSIANSSQTAVDTDWDRYILFTIFNFKGGEAGLMGTYDRLANGKASNVSFATSTVGFGANLTEIYSLQPFVKAKIGPVKLEGEFIYSWGSTNWQNGAPGLSDPILPNNNVDLQDILAYVNATVDLQMFYFGGTAAYMSGPGDNGSLTNTQVKGGYMGGGLDWNPCLIMFNNDLTYWGGGIPGYGGTVNGSNPGTGTGIGMTNAWFFQLDGGVRPIPKLDIKAAVSYAMADTTAVGQNNAYGWELDVTGTYKITNNLSYMLGVGYWWVGDFYKGGTAGLFTDGFSNDPSANHLRDDYMVINKLTLAF
jgi:hypothetical protein